MGFFSASDRENPSRPRVQVLPRDDAREHLLAIAFVVWVVAQLWTLMAL